MKPVIFLLFAGVAERSNAPDSGCAFWEKSAQKPCGWSGGLVPSRVQISSPAFINIMCFTIS